MGILNTCWVLLPIVLYLGSLADAGGKCTGRWAIHACGGGNGKRSDIDYPSPSEDSAGPESLDSNDLDSRQLDLLTRLTRLSARNGAQASAAAAALDARLRDAGGQEKGEETELARRWGAGDELVVDAGRELEEGERAEGARGAEEEARLQAALRLIKRLLVRKASAKVSNIQDITD